ncbi:hypothetical protein PVAP13_9KG201100 [Panicum virgatum]|nr:hypothetical protein PVAP13_9KG201100 [Panicum virgatum]
MRLKHPNVVLLVGWCSETQYIPMEFNGTYVCAEKPERLLCLEYMPKGNLRGFLSDESSGLGWDTRYKIIQGICYGLRYLHEEWQLNAPIVHMDLKPANILLDNNMVPKIADFGLSRLFSEEKTWTCTISRNGTLGYMSPEYINKGIVSTKSDIFSLGVIIIEIVTGHRDYPDDTGTPSEEFIEIVLHNWSQRNMIKKLSGVSLEVDYQQIRRCIQIGLDCVKIDRSKRLTISQIIKALHRPESADPSNIKGVDRHQSEQRQKKTALLRIRVIFTTVVFVVLLKKRGISQESCMNFKEISSISQKKCRNRKKFPGSKQAPSPPLHSPAAPSNTSGLLPTDRMDSLFSPRCVWVDGPIIVGAGPSGLAVAACLQEQGVPYVILERANCIAPLWQKRTYNRLKLHLPKQFHELPRMAFPDHYPKYPARRQFIDYFEHYAAKFEIKPEFSTTVLSAHYDNTSGLWRVATTSSSSSAPANGGGDMEYISRWLVVAMGVNADTVVPDISGLDAFDGKVTHVSNYKSGEAYTGKRVLVVGCGNSGMEVLLDLFNHGARPAMVVGDAVHVLPHKVLGKFTFELAMLLMRWLPIWIVDKIMVLLAWLVHGNLGKLGLHRPATGPFKLMEKHGRTPVLDYGALACIRAGDIAIVPAVTRFGKGGQVELTDGRTLNFDAVILASNVPQWLQGNDFFNKDGYPKTAFPHGWKGQSGLYAIDFTRRALSGTFADAVRIAKDLGNIWRGETKPRKRAGACGRRCISVFW